MNITAIEYGDGYYVTIDGQEDFLTESEYHTSEDNADREPCELCGKRSLWVDTKNGRECLRSIDSSASHVICSDCRETAHIKLNGYKALGS